MLKLIARVKMQIKISVSVSISPTPARDPPINSYQECRAHASNPKDGGGSNLKHSWFSVLSL